MPEAERHTGNRARPMPEAERHMGAVAERHMGNRARPMPEAERHMGAVAVRHTGTPAGRRTEAVSYTHLRAHETRHDLVCRLLLEKKKKKMLGKRHDTKMQEK